MDWWEGSDRSAAAQLTRTRTAFRRVSRTAARPSGRRRRPAYTRPKVSTSVTHSVGKSCAGIARRGGAPQPSPLRPGPGGGNRLTGRLSSVLRRSGSSSYTTSQRRPENIQIASSNQVLFGTSCLVRGWRVLTPPSPVAPPPVGSVLLPPCAHLALGEGEGVVEERLGRDRQGARLQLLHRRPVPCRRGALRTVRGDGD